MSEVADLLAAITAAPADDLPRLVFADWLDDRGEAEYAQFVRDQIRLAQVPQWDPLAVRARHQLKDTLGIGKPFFGTLPELPLFLKWHPEKAFRRGFGSGVVVHQLSGLLEAGPQLFDVSPVDELWLSAATLDEWRQFAKSPWLQNVRKLHFHFSQGLHEPIRCLAESKYAGSIDEIWFDTLATPAAGIVIEALAASPLVKQLTGLHMRLVHTPSLGEVIHALHGMTNLRKLSMIQAGIDRDDIVEFTELKLLDSLIELRLSQNQIDDWSIATMLQRRNFECLQSINLSFCKIESTIFKTNQGQGLKVIDFSGNILERYHIAEKLWSPKFSDLHTLNVARCGIDIQFIRKLTESRFWNVLVELDISHNKIGDRGYLRLLQFVDPVNLVSLILDHSRIEKQTKKEMESHFGDRLVWAEDDAATGLAR